MYNFEGLLAAYFSRNNCSDEFSNRLNGVLSSDSSMYHFTASGIVIRGNSILMIHHRYLKKWLQPGGHIDLGEVPHVAAQREVLEETGWSTNLIGDDVPIDIDIHLIPQNRTKLQSEHWHIDCAYLLEPVAHIETNDSELSKWFRFSEISNVRVRTVLEKLKLI